MKKIDTSFVTGSEGQPFLGRSLEFLQESYREALVSLTKASVVDTTGPVVLNGLVNSGAGVTYIISAGSVYYNDEIFQVDAQTVVITGLNTLVGNVVTTYDPVDPILFESGANNSVHQIRKIVFSDAASGSGAFDYNDLKTKVINKSNYVATFPFTTLGQPHIFVPSQTTSCDNLVIIFQAYVEGPSSGGLTDIGCSFWIRKNGIDQTQVNQSIKDDGKAHSINLVFNTPYVAGETIEVRATASSLTPSLKQSKLICFSA